MWKIRRSDVNTSFLFFPSRLSRSFPRWSPSVIENLPEVTPPPPRPASTRCIRKQIRSITWKQFILKRHLLFGMVLCVFLQRSIYPRTAWPPTSSSWRCPGSTCSLRWRWRSSCQRLKIQFTGVFPLCNATDTAWDCKNDLVSSQNAFPQRVWLLFGSLSPGKFGDEIYSVSDPECLSQIRIFSISDPGSWIYIFSIPDLLQRI